MPKEDLSLFNPWWQIKEVILHDATLDEFNRQTYQYYHPFFFNFPKNEDGIFTLRGPRQVGKSTLLKMLIKRLLLKENINPLNVFFFPADRIKDYNELFYLLLDYLTLLRSDNEKRAYLFIDEISSVDEWQRSIKQLADMGKLKQTLLLLTGSNVLDLRLSSERLPGRKGRVLETEIDFLPLSFAEFLFLVKPQWRSKNLGFYHYHLPKLHKYFLDYLTTGGFLKTINEYQQTKTITPSTFKIYAEWIVGDLLKAGRNQETAINIIKRLFAHLTSPFSFYTIAEKTGINSHMTVIDYLDILERMFVIFKLQNFSICEGQSYPQKNKKAYFYDPFIYNTFRVLAESYLDDAINHIKNKTLVETQLPILAENTIAAYLKRKYQKLYYGKLKDKEIDFVSLYRGKYHFFEVKYQNQIKKSEFDFFLKAEPKKKLTVVTRNLFQKVKNLIFIPLELFLLS